VTQSEKRQPGELGDLIVVEVSGGPEVTRMFS
jgi:hypothetical protein